MLQLKEIPIKLSDLIIYQIYGTKSIKERKKKNIQGVQQNILFFKKSFLRRIYNFGCIECDKVSQNYTILVFYNESVNHARISSYHLSWILAIVHDSLLFRER